MNDMPDLISDDEYCHSSCSSVNDLELISSNSEKISQEIVRMIQCMYQQRPEEFKGEVCMIRCYCKIFND